MWPAVATTSGGSGRRRRGERAADNAVISAEIEAVFEEHRGFYGSPRIHQEMPRSFEWGKIRGPNALIRG